MVAKGKPRIVRCVVSGVEIEYCGFGRPPKYSPAVKAEMLKAQRKTARQNQKRKKEAAKLAA